MWLPRNERKLLQAYYLKVAEQKGGTQITKELWYEVADLAMLLQIRNLKKAMRTLRCYGEWSTVEKVETGQNLNVEQLKKEIKQVGQAKANVKTANSALEERLLIGIRKHGSVPSVIGISLTANGWDTGREYNSWYYKTGGMWWAEYKGHWIWSVLAALVTFIIGWILGRH